MAEEINIEFDRDDDEAFLDRLNDIVRKTQGPGFEAFDVEEANIPPGTQPFSPSTQDRNEQRRQKRAEESERKRQIREQARQESEDRRRLFKDLKSQAQDKITESRAGAISDRIQSYTLASALGLQGYVGASLLDQFFIRPGEEAKIAEQQDYQDQLSKYQEEMNRQARQALQDQLYPPTPPQGAPQPPPPPPGSPPTIPRRGPPPTPLTPPTPPQGGPGSALGRLGPAAGIASAAILYGQAINSQISNIANNVQSSLGNTIRGNNTQAVIQGINTARSIVDPLGVNIPAQIAVEGFETLLGINSDILASIKDTIAFSPQTLVADIEGELLKFSKQVEIAQRLDGVTAQLVRANTQFDLAFSELRATVIENIGPSIAASLVLLTELVKLTNDSITTASAIAPFIPGWLGTLFGQLKAIQDILLDQATDLDASDINRQIQDFFNVELQIGKMPRGSMPPNP